MYVSTSGATSRLVGVTLLLAAGAATGAGANGLSIEVRARALVPGEPLRIEVLSPRPLRSIGGEFLGEPLFLVREDRSAPGERWTGWALIDLDQTPGPAVIELHGTAADGSVVAGTRALTVEPKEFPVEKLDVPPRYVEPPEEVRERLARERAKTARIYAARRPVTPASRRFERPVPGEPTSVFGTRRLFNGEPRSPHPGLDLRAASGTPVRASGPGLVVLAEDLYYSGNTVILDHGGGLFTVYAHLSDIGVREGEEIEARELLGHSGATGRVTGPHLHWGAKVGSHPFDPTALLDPVLFE